jgi:hypothetical protein
MNLHWALDNPARGARNLKIRRTLPRRFLPERGLVMNSSLEELMAALPSGSHGGRPQRSSPRHGCRPCRGPLDLRTFRPLENGAPRSWPGPSQGEAAGSPTSAPGAGSHPVAAVIEACPDPYRRSAGSTPRRRPSPTRPATATTRERHHHIFRQREDCVNVRSELLAPSSPRHRRCDLHRTADEQAVSAAVGRVTAR